MHTSNTGDHISAYDIEPLRSQQLASDLGRLLNLKIEIQSELKKALSEHSIIVEATNSADTIPANDLAATTFIAAPGMPLGLNPAARKKVSKRLLHDPLQIGVATMGMAALKQILQDK